MHEYVPNLSISIRTGKETNMDFFSSGERTRKSSSGNSSCRAGAGILWKEEQDVVIAHTGQAQRRVVLLGSAV